MKKREHYPAGHVVSMSLDHSEAISISVARCECGWESRVPWRPAGYIEQDEAVNRHWDSSAAKEDPDWPFGELRRGRYRAILADPPWDFSLRSAAGAEKSAQAHYGCMSLADIMALPVADLALNNSILVMWATAPMLPHAIGVMSRWGFRYVSAGPWAKQSSTGASWAFGTGYWMRSAAEFFLLGTSGAPPIKSRDRRNLIVAPVREHSRKPDEIYELVEALSDGPYLELFARRRRSGWDSWGNELESAE